MHAHFLALPTVGVDDAVELRDWPAAGIAASGCENCPAVAEGGEAAAAGRPFVEVTEQYRWRLPPFHVRLDRLDLMHSPYAGEVEMHADDMQRLSLHQKVRA